ncbi:MAG: hypothetical protein DRJ32_04135 [Thermoprotei archaeon]|nr:MAG: hypothetical protein DRJ32_04135 [Thermoprotei archaeon]
MLRLYYFVPAGQADSIRVKEVEVLLDKVKSALKIDVNKVIIDKKGELELKSNILWKISVAKKIGIKKTRRTGSLYPQLVIYIYDKPVTFYPQLRGAKEISVKDFLQGLLKGEIRCLHDKSRLESELKKLM